MEENNKTPEELRADIINYHSELFVGSEDNKSIKEQIENIHESAINSQADINEKYEQIKKFFSDLFENTEARNSIEEKIAVLYKKLFVDNEEGKSIKTEIEDFFNNAKEKHVEFIKYVDETKELHNNLILGSETKTSVKQKIEEFYSKLFIDTAENKSISTSFNTLMKKMEEDYSSSHKHIRDLKDFYDDVFLDKKRDDGFVIKSSLINEIDKQKEKLDTLIDTANEKLYALTDSSLHNTFATRAEQYTNEFKKLEQTTFYLILGIIGEIALFGVVQLILLYLKEPFNYHLLIYQFSIAGALVFAIWMYNRNQKIAKKLAEEYHHKAAIAEAMTGYRQLYGLNHESEEYMELFNSLKDQLNINPSKAIDKFLNLKSPQEELTKSIQQGIDITNVVKNKVK